jgi:hypothetical protein
MAIITARYICHNTSCISCHHIRSTSCYSRGVSSQPHDTIFKAAFEHPVHAAGLFRDLLPNSLTDALDWDTLALEPGSFVDPSLIKSHSDLLFSAQLDGQKLLLYVLLEHFDEFRAKLREQLPETERPAMTKAAWKLRSP